MAEDRSALHCYLDVDTRDAWKHYAEENGVSETALIEAIGREIRQFINAGTDMMDVWPERIKVARRIDGQRRRRGGR